MPIQPTTINLALLAEVINSFFAENLTLIVVPRVLERRVPENGSQSHLKPS